MREEEKQQNNISEAFMRSVLGTVTILRRKTPFRDCILIFGSKHPSHLEKLLTKYFLLSSTLSRTLCTNEL